jgi:hypothetical protein
VRSRWLPAEHSARTSQSQKDELIQSRDESIQSRDESIQAKVGSIQCGEWIDSVEGRIDPEPRLDRLGEKSNRSSALAGSTQSKRWIDPVR